MIDDDEDDDYDGDGDDDYDDEEEEKEKDVRKGNPPNRLDSNTFICNLYGTFGKNFFYGT